MSDMSRKEVIDWLCRLRSNVPTFMPKIWHEKFIEALGFAISSLEIDEAYQLEYEKPTTKKDLVSSIVEEISEQVTETHEEFIFETIRPYCENVVQMKISKRDLEQALLKYYGKNDLGVDCVSRAQAQTKIEMNASRYTIARERGGMGQVEWSDQLIKVSDAVDIIRNLPSVTLQEPRKGEWLRMSDLSEQEDDRYKCSCCGNVVHYTNKINLYTFNNWCGRCGSDNGIHIHCEVEK